MNGGVKKEDLGTENVAAVKKGCANLGRHLENVKQFGVPAVVAINHFTSDTEAEIAGGEGLRRRAGRRSDPVPALGQGLGGHRGSGATRWSALADSGAAQFAPLYPDEMPLFEKINTIVQRIYRGSEAIADKSVREQLKHGKSRATATCRYAWPRRSIRSRPTRTCAARRPAIRAGARGAAFGRRRLRRRHLRRDHDHARPAQAAVVARRSSSTRWGRSRGCSDRLMPP